MRLPVAILFLIGTICSAQLVRDFRPYRAVGVGLVADAAYSVKKLNVPITGLYSVSGDRMEEATNSYFQTAGTTGLVYLAGLEQTLIGTLLSISPVTALTTMAQIIAAESNTQFRYYMFYVPVRSNYSIQAFLKGDWDRPRNRFVIVGPTGVLALNYEEQLGSNQHRIFSLTLDPGIYTAMVGLGGGSSILLHTAGDLEGVMLDSPTTISWSMPVVVQQSLYNLLNYLPNPGDIANLTITFSGYPSGNSPNIIDGSPIVYSGIRAASAAVITGLNGESLGTPRAINKPITFIEPQVSLLSSPIFNGSTATFTVLRLDDLIWIDDPCPDGSCY